MRIVWSFTSAFSVEGFLLSLDYLLQYLFLLVTLKHLPCDTVVLDFKFAPVCLFGLIERFLCIPVKKEGALLKKNTQFELHHISSPWERDLSGEEFTYLFGPSCKIDPLYLSMIREQFVKVLSWNIFKPPWKLQQATGLLIQKQALQHRRQMIITMTRAHRSERTWKHLRGSYHFFVFCVFLLLFFVPE